MQALHKNHIPSIATSCLPHLLTVFKDANLYETFQLTFCSYFNESVYFISELASSRTGNIMVH